MKGITDIHSHILYGVDDGSDSLDTSVKILQEEYRQGVKNIILTPHFHVGEYMTNQKTIREHYNVLKEVVKEKIPELNIYLGNEIMACNDMVSMLNEGKLNTLLETAYVLVEFYPTVRYEMMVKYISNLLNGGYIPIVAHCERYSCLRSSWKKINLKNISHLVEMGAYMQVNAISVFDKEIKFVEKLIDNDLLHLVATDAHSLGKRGIYWQECIRHLRKKYNDDYIEWLLADNPGKVLKGQYI
jgi:protein-tyrosine phosphatase